MSNQIKKYGIMGGTFDPIHAGHLVIAEEIRYKFNLDKVIFIPAGNPPHKDSRKVTSSNHRYQMALLATISNPYFDISSIELEREGITYTIDTIMELKKCCGDGAEFYFITGADSLLQLSTWKDVDKLLSICKFVAATRPGFQMSKIETKVKELESKYNRSIYTVTVPALQISSTDIRNRIKNGMTVKYLLPESVEAYIIKHKLYQDNVEKDCI
ncbi:nicotinate-nucleotide adenylyltransferase [Proteiniborus ethanoligenes]|uniref:Probable nicotinate-nucleotide adenylyltransferase n=1 Tax=Proteiniborus ethanoligenes TaxID=415015 RepID=A0A1H3S947_9FIRM|nr:nicotinate-nucleotide adenylyltransferase [Proteiniborus ethanoligenes]TAH63770.1 MAG: nicotinate-nucleotide adenylyltransferase [Gottschalkiaceae bacterium]SDZ34434.1 nicotinate-nucleotide adenylyltransferase [Proteiniborus ethanoligenes]